MASVLITGASKGIGRATAKEFARRGHRVIATARDPRTLAGLPVDQRLALDVTNPDSITSAVGEAGEVDVLVSNAGEILLRRRRGDTAGGARAAARHQHDPVPCGWRRRSCQGCAPAAAGGCCSCPASPGASCRRARRPTPRPNGPSRRWSRPWPPRRARWASRPRCSNRARSAPARSTTSPPTPCPTIPIPTCPARGGAPASQMTPEEVAAGIADAAEAPQLPLRIPIGRPAAQILAARRAAPDDRPFVPGASTAVRS